MANAQGSFSLTKLFNASVTSISTTVGWNEQQSSATVGLVENVAAGDVFTPPPVGTPCRLDLGGFTFQGLLQRTLRKGDVSGNPLYEVRIDSPTQVLAGAKVILSSFVGPTGGMPNLLNAYGYWESTLGFGGSMLNESGMLWEAPLNSIGVTPSGIGITQTGSVGIKPALAALMLGAGDYGGPIQFRGYSYKVDFTGLPTPPAYYRLGGVARSILELVSEVCQDGGYDYIVYLDGDTIRFKTVSRLTQPVIGQISDFVASRSDVASKGVGVELRNDITNAVLVGGDYHQMVPIYNINADDTIWPYWGRDAFGVPIVGVGQPEVWHEFYLNCSPIADIMGSLQYHCTIPELRLAASDYDSWATWVMRHYPDKAAIINLVGAMDSKSDLEAIFGPVAFQKDFVAADPATVLLMGGMNEKDYWSKRAQVVYEFVRQYATEYFGRKFMVKIPFGISYTVEPETTNVLASDEPVEAGYALEGSMPLGLNFLNEDIFLADDGRMECFCLFPLDPNIDLQKLSPSDYVIQSGGVYVRARVSREEGIIYPGGSPFPHAVIELSNAVCQLPPDALGGVADIAVVVGYSSPEAVVAAAAIRHGDFPCRITPPPYRPIGVALPMRSNRTSYGPWGTFPPWGNLGVAGQVYFERDESLTPWEYGDVNTMNQAASAKLSGMLSNMQESETATFEVAGEPEVSLGDVLVAGGPNVTGISVTKGVQGVRTTYDMRTFTRDFGSYGKENADRLRRLGLMGQQVRRAIRNLFHRRAAFQQTVLGARRAMLENTSRAVRQATPHDVLYARMTFTNQFGYRTQASISTYPEAVANCRGDVQEIWEATGAMSLEGLLRPFSTTTDSGPRPGTGDMPHHTLVDHAKIPVGTPACDTLNPFGQDNDIDIVAWGSVYPGEMHRLKGVANETPPDYTQARLLGLRGPLEMVGWGYEYTGKPLPNASEAGGANPGAVQTWSSNFLDKHRMHPEYWRAGPVALHYDTWRGVWTVPTTLRGTLDTSLVTNEAASALMSITVKGVSLGAKVAAWCDLGGPTLAAGTKVVVDYDQLSGRWYVGAASCPS